LTPDLTGYLFWEFSACCLLPFSLSFLFRAVKAPDPDLPPFIHSWNQFYGIVIGWLVFLIFIFWLITILFE
jgi:hypothetical protein